jgi:hypothetical protein
MRKGWYDLIKELEVNEFKPVTFEHVRERYGDGFTESEFSRLFFGIKSNKQSKK